MFVYILYCVQPTADTKSSLLHTVTVVVDCINETIPSITIMFIRKINLLVFPTEPCIIETTDNEGLLY